MTAPSIRARLRRPHASETVAVALTGDPVAVTAIARALASVTVVTGMHHRVNENEVIRLNVTCHPVRRVETAARKAARRP